MSEHLVICIARQFGSGGREVGLAVAEAMGLAFYDKELLKTAAKNSGIVEELFEKNDEKAAPGGLFSLLDEATKMPSFSDYSAYMPNDQIQHAISQAVRDAAAAGPCVIIGRCADYVLRGRPGTLTVYLHASREKRTLRIARLRNLDEEKAWALIRKTDRSRGNYYGFYTDRDWGDPANYDICVDVGRFGVPGAANVVQNAAQLVGGSFK